MNDISPNFTYPYYKKFCMEIFMIFLWEKRYECECQFAHSSRKMTIKFNIAKANSLENSKMSFRYMRIVFMP